MIRKLISVLLAALMLAASAVIAHAGSSPFSDVKEKRWSHDSIIYAYENGLMDGVGGGKFDPAGTMTRGMVVTVLWRMENKPGVTFRDDFSDVKPGKYYSNAVIWAKDNNIVNGVSEGKFDPAGKITREQLAAMFFRYANYKNYVTDERGVLDTFDDAGKIHSYAVEPLSWAVGAGLITGVTAKTISPRTNATREQFATILQRFAGKEFVTLADVYREVIGSVADEAEVMLRESMERRKNDPDGTELLGSDDGALVFGLFEAGRYDAVREYVEFLAENGIEPGGCWSGFAGYAIEGMYEMTGEEIYAGYCRSILDCLMRISTDEHGEIQYGRPGTEKVNNDIYVDGTGLAGIFLGRYADLFDDGEVKELAELQVRNYLDYGVMEKIGLVAHGYNGRGVQEGEIGWGRGTGWFMLAAGSVMRYCGDDGINERCDALMEKTMKKTLPGGMFGWTLSSTSADTPPDTSATGMIMWGILKAKEKGLAGGVTDEQIKKTAAACLDYIKEGRVYGASGASAGWYFYSDNYNENNALGQGSALAFLSLDLGMLESGK